MASLSGEAMSWTAVESGNKYDVIAIKIIRDAILLISCGIPLQKIHVLDMINFYQMELLVLKEFRHGKTAG
jgi:hypothetical protein